MSTSSEWVAGWLASEDTALDAINVKRIYIDINDGNLHDGILFSQIMYWHGRNKETGKSRLSIERNGEMWLAKSYDDWYKECRIISSTARKCINRIAKRKLIVKKLFRFNGAPTIHVRINWPELEKCIKSICDVVSNPNDTTYQKEMIPEVKFLTETTPKNTTEKPIHASSDASKTDPHPKRHYFEAVAKGVFEISDFKGLSPASLKRIGLLEKTAKTTITTKFPHLTDEQGALLLSKYCAAEKFKPNLQGQTKFELGLSAYLEKNSAFVPGFLAQQPSPKPEEPTEFVDPELVKKIIADTAAKLSANDKKITA